MSSTDNQDLLLGAALQAGITDRRELANFMAQMQVESGGYARMHENLNYSASGLLRTFPGRNGIDSRDEAQVIAARGPEGVAEAIYGGEWGRANLGNTEPGDGWRFHGRGFVHLTGRENYERYGTRLGVDLVGNPDLAADPEIAARIAVAYWHDRVERRGHDVDVTAATRDINGGSNGLAERRAAATQWETRLTDDYIRQHARQPAAQGDGAPQVDGRQPASGQPSERPQDDGGIRLSAAYEMGQQYDDVRYAINIPGHRLYRGEGIDGKHLDQGYIDCSGWVVAMQNRTMAEINAAAGREVFGRSDLFNPGNDGSGTIVKKAFERSGVLLEGDAVREPGALREGMVIGVDSGRTRHEHWKGIDHIVMVVRNPQTGELMASQSTGSKGVHMMPLDDYLSANRDTALFASDPLAKARGLLQDRQQALGERSQDTQQAGRQPLVSDAAHPGHALFADVSRRIAEQTGSVPRPEVAANIALQMLENGIRGSGDIQGFAVRGSDVHIQGAVTGSRVSVDLNAPTADLQAMSDHMTRQVQEQERQALERQRAQAPSMAQ